VKWARGDLSPVLQTYVTSKTSDAMPCD
jgi:hypothetical protein